MEGICLDNNIANNISQCAFCGEDIVRGARRCPYCGSIVERNYNMNANNNFQQNSSISLNKDVQDQASIKRFDENPTDDRPVYQQSSQSASDMLTQNIDKPTRQLFDQPMDQMNQPMDQSIGQPMDQLIGQPMDQSISQPVNQSLNQQMNQQINQPSNSISNQQNYAYSMPLSNRMKVFITTISTFIPWIGQLIGLIAAIVYVNSEDDNDRKSFGFSLMISSLIIFVINLFIGCIVAIALYNYGVS